MISKTRVMVYVDDVNSVADFWVECVGATLIGKEELPENYSALTLQITEDFELGLFPKAFIAKYSPEVLDNKPSILFYTHDLEALNDRIPSANEIMEMGNLTTFNFSDPEGNYFAVAKA